MIKPNQFYNFINLLKLLQIERILYYKFSVSAEAILTQTLSLVPMVSRYHFKSV